MVETLVSQLTSELGISEEQASGSTGALLAMAKEKLGGDFSQISDGIPGIEDLISKAPSAGGSEGAAGGILGAAAGMLGDKAGLLGKVDDLAGLADTFLGLGLDADQIGNIGQIILKFVQEKLGDQAAGLLKGLIN